MASDTIICRDVTIAYMDKTGNVIFTQEHRIWDSERFFARLNKECAKNREKGEGYTQWQLQS